MGAWGTGIMENDSALDAKSFYDRGEKPHWDCPEVWLALGVHHMENNTLCPDKDIVAIQSAIEFELLSEQIEDWKRPDARRSDLLHFQECFNKFLTGQAPTEEDLQRFYGEGLMGTIFKGLYA